MRNLLLFGFLLVFSVARSQQTFVYTDPNAAYRKGVELFEEKNYASARRQFEKIYEQRLDNTASKNTLLWTEVEYMIAVSAAENNDVDAEPLLFNFLQNHSDSHRSAYINFYLGRYYYMNNKYQECIDQLAKLSADEIPDKYRTDYKFQLGYCYFVKKKFDEAKPLFKSIKDIKEKYYYPSNYYYAFICFYRKEYNEALKSFLAIEDSKMFSSVIPYYVSQIYYMKKDYDKTITYIKSHIDNTDVTYRDEMNHLLGESYFQKSDYAKALPLLEAHVAKNTKVRKEDIYELAYSYYKMGDYKNAISNFLQLNLVDDKMGQNATYTLADCYLKVNEKEKAKAAFQSAAAKNFDVKTQQNALFNFAKLSLEMGNPTECVSALEQYLATNPSTDNLNEANELMAVALLQSKDYDRAYEIIEKLRTLSPSLKEAYQRVTYFRALQLYNDGKTQASITLCDKSLKYPVKGELQAGAYYVKAENLYAQKSYADAFSFYQKCDQLMTQEYASILGFGSKHIAYNSAYALFKLKQYERSANYFKKYINSPIAGQEQMLEDAQLRLAECSFVEKDFSVALRNYDVVAKSSSTEAEYANFQKGIVLGLMNRDAEKIDVLKDLIQKYPISKTLDRTYFEIGETYLDMDNSNGAISYYNQLIQNYPKSSLVPSSYLKIGLAEYNQGNKEGALKQYKYLIANYPSSKESKQALSAIKDLGVELGRPDEYIDVATVSQSEKDSLTYQAAENAYTSNDCDKAIILFDKYLDKFPKGYFIQEAHLYRSECLLKQKQYTAVLVDYDALIQSSPKFKEKALLNASGVAYFELKDYARAMGYYKALAENSSTYQNTYTGIVGVLKCASKTNNHGEVIKAADRIINNNASKETDVAEAYYLKAKSAYTINSKEVAYAAFNKVAAGPSSERAAESKYMTAKILRENNLHKASLDTCFKIKSKFASYEYWYVKTFILMADNYYQLGNVLQAKATLESIVANYKGDDTLLEEAKAKLDEINNEELKKSRIMEIAPSDEMQMIQGDSILNNQNLKK